MAANLNLKQRVKAGEISIDSAKQLLREHAGVDTEKTSTWRWLCRLDAALGIKSLVACLAMFLLVACGGLKQEAMVIPGDNGTFEKPHYVVMTSLVNAHTWADQPQMDGEFHCTGKIDSIQMADLRAKHGPNVVGYTGCQPLKEFKNQQYAVHRLPGTGVLLVDMGKALVYSAAGAYGMHELGKGLGKSGTTVNQSGGGADSSSSADADAVNSPNSGNVTKNLNSHNKTNVNKVTVK